MVVRRVWGERKFESRKRAWPRKEIENLSNFFINFILGLFCMSSGELMVYSGVLNV